MNEPRRSTYEKKLDFIARHPPRRPAIHDVPPTMEASLQFFHLPNEPPTVEEPGKPQMTQPPRFWREDSFVLQPVTQTRVFSYPRGKDYIKRKTPKAGSEKGSRRLLRAQRLNVVDLDLLASSAGLLI